MIYWRKRFLMELNELKVEDLMGETITGLKQAISQLYQGYQNNTLSSKSKMDDFNSRNMVSRIISRYPLCLCLVVLICLTSLYFYKTQMATITRVLQKDFTI